MKKTILLALLACTSAAAQGNNTTSTSNFRGDGFSGYRWSSDGCRTIDVYLSGSDYWWRNDGQPQSSNYLWGYAWVFDCETQSWGWAYIDQNNATLDARGPTGGRTTVRGSVEIQSGHWEQDTEETCFTWEEYCWTDWNGEQRCEPAGEYCYYSWHWVQDPSQTLAFDLAIAPEGDTYRGVSMSTQKGPSYMYRYRYTGSERYGAMSGSLTLDGEDLLGTTSGLASVWTANSGSMTAFRY